MAFIREFGGERLVCVTKRGRFNPNAIPPEELKKNYIVKYEGDKSCIRLGEYRIWTSKELAGKRVRLKVEVIED